MSQIREVNVAGRSTDTFGRVLCSARNHHFIVDGPVQNGCPGEELTPPEVFMSSVIACGVELAQVIAQEDGLGAIGVQATIYAKLDRGNPVRADVTVFNEVRMNFVITGLSLQDARTVVEKFQKRCPLFGTLAVATPNLVVDVTT